MAAGAAQGLAKGALSCAGRTAQTGQARYQVGTLGALKLPPFGGEAKAAEVHGPARTLVQSRCLAAPGAALALFLGLGTPARDDATYEAGVIAGEAIASVVWERLVGGGRD